jgi:hypothetical protein
VTDASTRAILGSPQLIAEIGLVCVFVTLALLLLQDIASGTDTVLTHRLRRGVKLSLIPSGLSFAAIAISQLSAFFR